MDATERWWDFAPARVTPARGEREAEALRRVGALRGYPGGGGSIRWVWRSGRRPVRLGVRTRGGVGWVRDIWTPSYGTGTWAAGGPPSRGDPRPIPYGVRFGSPARSSASSFRDDLTVPWSEDAIVALQLLPEGAEVEWELEPLGQAPGPARPQAKLVEQPPGFRLGTSGELQRELEDRRARRESDRWWAVHLEIHVERRPGAADLVDRVARALEVASARRSENRFRFRTPSWARRQAPWFPISEGEVAALFPSSWCLGRSTLEPPPREGGLRLGTAVSGRPVLWPIESREGRHLAALGGTGVGKSSTILALARRASRVGCVVLFDPIGDTARAFLSTSAVSEGDATWISPADSPVPVDMVAELRSAGPGTPEGERALDDVVACLRRVREARFRDTPFWGPRIEETVRAALAAAAAYPAGSLADAERLLDGALGRPPLAPPEARASVDELRRRARERPEEVDGSRRLLREITGRPTLDRLLADPRARYSPRRIGASRGAVVVSGDAAQVGEAASRYLLSVHLALLWAGRLGQPDPPKMFLILDEVQWYAHATVAEMLRLGRRTNLHVVLATQSLAALPDEVQEAIRTNVADFLLFRGSPDDAAEAHRWAPSVRPDSILGLRRGEALLLLEKGRNVEAMVVDLTQGPRDPPRADRLDRIRAASARWIPDPSPDPPSEDSATPLSEPADLRPLWVGVLASRPPADGGLTTTLPLRRFRAAFDPGGERVRAAGRTLTERGGMVRVTRGADGGTQWTVDLAAVRELLGPVVSPEELADARARWSAAGAPLGPGSTQLS